MGLFSRKPNPQKELESLDKDLDHTLDWAASAYSFLKEFRLSLNNFSDADDLKGKSQWYKDASPHLRNALRSATKMQRFYERAIKSLWKITPLLPHEEQEEIKKIEHRLDPHASALTREASFFRGNLKKDFQRLGVLLALAQKPGALWVRKGEFKEYEQLQASLPQKVNDLIAERGGEVGLVPFMAEVRNLKKRMEKLRRKVV